MSIRNRPWPIDKFPGGCVECGTTEIGHKARGLCFTCYARQSARVSASRKRGEEPVVAPAPDALADFDPFTLPEPEEAQFSGGEVRPGTPLSPGTPTGPDLAAGVVPPSNPIKRLFAKKDDRVVVTPPQKTNEVKRPGGVKRSRKSIANDLEQLVGSLGARLSRQSADGRPMGKHYSLGQYLQWNAPATAEVLDENLRDTVVDRKLLQPLVAGKNKMGAIGGVLAPPLFIFAIEANPNLLSTLYPALYMTIEASLDSLMPAKKRAEARAKKRAETIREAFGPDVPPGVDPVASMIESLFPWAFDGSGTTPEPAPERATSEDAQ